MSKEILITGVDGFLGGTMYDNLKNSGESVVGSSFKESEVLSSLGIVRLDVSDREAVFRQVRNKPEVIANFAGIAAPSVVKESPDLAWSVNVGGMINIVEAVLAVRKIDNTYNPVILGAGSIEEFGNNPTDEQGNTILINEETTPDPLNLYAKQKKEAGDEVMKLCLANHIQFYWIHQGNAIGAPAAEDLVRSPIHLRHGQDLGFFVPDVARQIAEIEASGQANASLTTGHIEHKRNFIYGEDAIDAWISLAKKRPASGRYIVCSGDSVSLEEVLNTLLGFSLVEIIHKIEGSKGGVGKDRYYTNSKIKKATGWLPETTLRKALRTALDDQRAKVR